MKSKRRWPWYILLMLLILAAVIYFFPYSYLNDFQKEGVLSLKGLKKPVRVLRDEKGMAYIYAENIEDVYE